MARRRKAQLPAAAWIDWSPEIAARFEPYRELISDYPAPRRVRLFHGLRHITLLARFAGPYGVFVSIKIKIARAA